MKYKIIAICAFAFALCQIQAKTRTILIAPAPEGAAAASSAKDDGFDAEVLYSDGDATPAVIRALDEARKAGGDVKIVFKKGRHDFKGSFGRDIYCFISNNDEGLKRVIFPIVGQKDITIDGGGSEFVFHGLVSPFLIQGSENVRLENFSVDTARPFHTEAEIVKVEKDHAIVKFSEKFPYRILDGILQFVDSNKYDNPKNATVYQTWGYLVYDKEKRQPAYNTFDTWAKAGFIAEKLPDGTVKIMGKFTGEPGQILVFTPFLRNHPGIVISDSKNVSLDKVEVRNCGGMAIIGQRSRDIFVRNCRVTPSEGAVVSATADATHFSNCEGKIVLENNFFESQLDDFTNIHGIYERIEKVISPRKILTKLVHYEQFGFGTFRAGDRVEIIGGKSMICKNENRIKSVERINKEYSVLELESDIPSDVKALDAVAVLRDWPEVVIRGNTARGNRARGMLINSRGKTLVENNHFMSAGTAILFEGDSCFWFEQGGTRDCTIRGNTFENCLYANWGNAVISVRAGIREDRETSRYNKNILIENNTFKMFDDASLLNIYCVDSLTWRNNKVEKTNAYPPMEKRKGSKKFVVEHCSNINIEE